MRDWTQKQLYRVPPWFVWTVLAICTVVGVYDLMDGQEHPLQRLGLLPGNYRSARPDIPSGTSLREAN